MQAIQVILLNAMYVFWTVVLGLLVVAWLSARPEENPPIIPNTGGSEEARAQDSHCE